jgi:hypothetical protein
MNHTGLCSKRGDAIPLKGVEVDGEVLGAHARVRVRQRYCNESGRAVEAVYTFPLPADATLTAFAMTCAGRRLEGSVKEREAAFHAYDDAVVAGHGAALLEQERSNVFTATVGNLLPGEETLVEVEYVQRVTADEGSLRWMIPTLVAPRYIPGSPGGDRTAHGEHPPTDRVPDADRITPPRAAEVGYGLKLDLLFDLGRAVKVESPSHAITAMTEGARVRVRFAQAEVALDRDVVLTARGPGSAGLAGRGRGRAPCSRERRVPGAVGGSRPCGRWRRLGGEGRDGDLRGGRLGFDGGRLHHRGARRAAAVPAPPEGGRPLQRHRVLELALVLRARAGALHPGLDGERRPVGRLALGGGRHRAARAPGAGDDDGG